MKVHGIRERGYQSPSEKQELLYKEKPTIP